MDTEAQLELLSARFPDKGPRFRLAQGTSLCTRTVVDNVGEVLGSVADLLLDLERGCIAYVIVATGGFLGVGERLFALPWAALRADGAQLELQARRRDLEDAPVFDRKPWAQSPAASWHQRVHDYYRARPYWS